MGVYAGELAWIDQVHLLDPLKDVSFPYGREYCHAYGVASKTATDAGQQERAAVYGLMHDLMGIWPTFERQNEPYAPWQSHGDMRTCLPQDFEQLDIDAIRHILQQNIPRGVRAHLNDMLFLSPAKDFRAAREAASQFFELAAELKTTPQPRLLHDAMLRSLQLVRIVDRRGELGIRVRDGLVALTKELGVTPYPPNLLVALRICREQDLGVAREWLGIARCAATHYLEQSALDTARDYFNMAVRFAQRASDQKEERQAWQDVGSTYVEQAKSVISRSAQHATYFLQQGIEAHRRGRSPKPLIDELSALLRHTQEQIGDELMTFSEDVDITEFVRNTEASVADADFGISLARVAFGQPVVDVDALRATILEAFKQHPIVLGLNTEVLGAGGRKVDVQPGLLGLDGEAFESALKKRMISQASQFHWSFRTQVHIEPARRVFLQVHHPRTSDLRRLVMRNPFIPEGHEEIYLKGLLAGFHGDFIMAAHLLVPQLENSVRHLLASRGVHVTYMNHDGTEPYKVWGGLLELPEFEQVFGKNYRFEFEGLLLSSSGFNFRHVIAHGMVTDMECQNIPGLNAWWLALRLCLTPVLHRFVQTPASGDMGDTNGGEKA